MIKGFFECFRSLREIELNTAGVLKVYVIMEDPEDETVNPDLGKEVGASRGNPESNSKS